MHLYDITHCVYLTSHPVCHQLTAYGSPSTSGLLSTSVTSRSTPAGRAEATTCWPRRPACPRSCSLTWGQVSQGLGRCGAGWRAGQRDPDLTRPDPTTDQVHARSRVWSWKVSVSLGQCQFVFVTSVCYDKSGSGQICVGCSHCRVRSAYNKVNYYIRQVESGQVSKDGKGFTSFTRLSSRLVAFMLPADEPLYKWIATACVPTKQSLLRDAVPGSPIGMFRPKI